MLALVQNAGIGWAGADRPVPQSLAQNEALIRIRAVGICGTDLGILQGDYSAAPGIILGHEAAGEVVAVGEHVKRIAVGMRVAIDPTYFCGECRMCRTGRPNHCVHKVGTETGVTRDGCFTQYYVTEERFLYPLEDHVGFPAASLTEPLSCVLTGANRLRLRPGLRTVVLGGGPIGTLYAAVLALRGLQGTIVESAPARRGILQAIDLSGWRAVPCLADVTDDELDVVVDTTGHLAQEAIARLACGGQLLFVGLKRNQATIEPGKLADRSISLIGSIDSVDTFSDAIALITAGRVPAEKLVTHTLPLTEWQAGLELLGLGSNGSSARTDTKAMKVVLVP